jgi:hypothetical protein
METKKIYWPASLNKCKMIYMVTEIVLCIIIENKLLMMMMKCYHLELMLSSGTKCYHLGRNVIIWS